MTKTLTSMVMIALGGIAVAEFAAADTGVTGIDGTWESLACEVRPQAGADGTVQDWWLTRRVAFNNGRIEAWFTTYAGPGCDLALNELHFAGSVTVQGDSAVMAGAKEADLMIDEFVNITPLAQGFADFLNSAPAGTCSSGWGVGVAQDVLPAGCAILGVQPNTPTVEYEVLAVQGDHLYFGARRVDGSFLTTPELRPKALLVPAVRVAD